MLDILKKISLSLSAALLLFAVACQKENPDVPPIPEPDPADPQEYNLENRLVRSYLNRLDKQPYKDGDYTYSWIDDYWQLSTTYRKDRPAGVTVQWTKDVKTSSQKIYVSENPDFADSWCWSVKNSLTSYEILNLVPGCKYYWKVVGILSGNETVLKEGEFLTTGRRRFLSIDNICNVRDLGGIPTLDGRTISYCHLYRGGEMNGYNQDYDDKYCRVSAYGITELRQCGIAADLDLRTADEAVNITESPLGKDIDYVRFESANTYYYDKFWTSDVYIKAFQWMINELRRGKPVLFHCIYGADRTGTLAFLIEALLGVGENQIAMDYELTSFSYGLNAPPRRRGPKNELSVYRYRQMLEGVLTSSKFKGKDLQERVRNFLLNGYPGAKAPVTTIPEEDLDWFVSIMLE